MSDKIIDISEQRAKKDLKRKEENIESMRDRFEKALPLKEKNSQKSLLNIFKRKKK